MNINIKNEPGKNENQNFEWLDTDKDPALDHLTALTCSIFDIAACYVSIAGEYQSMFKSLKGVDPSRQPTKHSLCNHTIESGGIYIVEDTTKDPTHKNHPQSFGSTKIIFHAGYPLITQNGLNLGALCLIDSKPRSFSTADRDKLANLGRICLATLENSNLRDQTVEYARTSKRLNDAKDLTARLANMLERSSNEFYVFDGATLKFRYINQRALNNLGYSQDEMLEITPLDIKKNMTVESVAPLLEQLRSGDEQQVLFHALHQRKNGELYPIDIRLERDCIGTKEVFIAMGMDVTEKRLQEAEVEMLSDLNQAIFDSSEAGILSMQAIYNVSGEIVDFRFVAANPTVGKILNRAPETIIGKTICENFPQRIEQGIFDKYKRVVETGEPIIFETHLQETNFLGWHRVSAVPTGKDGVTISFISIDKIKSTEIQLQKTNAELRQTNDILNQFNSIVAHDLKRPIRHMNLFAELLLEDIDDPDLTTQTAHKIIDSAKRAQNMVRSLTEFASVGRHSLIFKTVSIGKTLQTVKAQLKDKLDISNAFLPVGDLPFVKGDENLIIQLFTNLIENSIKYRSNKPPMLDLRFQEEETMICFQLHDNGIGIPKDQATNVFRMFQRLPNSLHQQGNGVGLAIYQRIVQSHGGRIWIDPNYTEGTCIHFSLPKAMPENEVSKT